MWGGSALSAQARKSARQRRKNPFSNALPAPLRRPEGCTARCVECYARCLGGIHDGSDGEPRTEHWWPCECEDKPV